MNKSIKSAGVCTLALFLAGGCLSAAAAKTDNTVKLNKTETYTFGKSKSDVSVSNYTEKTGIGLSAIDGTFDKISKAANGITASESFQFKVRADNGNYEITAITNDAAIISEAVMDTVTYKDDNGAAATYTPPKDKETGMPLIGVPETVESGKPFQVAVCDGILDLTFVYSGQDITLSSIKIAPVPVPKRTKPYLLTVGDSTTNLLTSDRCSWGNVIDQNQVSLPESLGGFYNGGSSGADDITYYCWGKLQEVLLRVAPGDYVTVNMGINQAKKYTLGNIQVAQSDSRAAMMPLMEKYVIEGIIQRGGIPVITTITARGPYDKDGTPENNGGLYYNADTPVTTDDTIVAGVSYKAGQTIPANTWNDSRHASIYNIHLYSMANNYNLKVIDLGIWAEAWYQSLNADSVASFNTANASSYTSVFDMIKTGYYADQNHYHATLGIVFAQYMLSSIDKIIAGTYAYPYASYQPCYLKNIK